MFAACDTFRAGAEEQLGIWGETLSIPVLTGEENQDPASVAFEAMKQAREQQIDVLLIDTAGRLHTQKNLMEELGKIQRVVQKSMPRAPHETFLVLDSTTGQNAVHQARLFHEMLKLTGLVMTKLDGTAKGGVVLGIQEELNLPIRFVGVGEKFSDLQIFNPVSYSQALFEEN
jgi:fused signal recognition particle receptor